MSLKYWAYLAIIIAVGYGCYTIYDAFQERAALKLEVEQKNQTISNLKKASDDTLLQAIKDNTWSLKYQSDLDRIKNESKTLTADINANPSIVYIHANCPKLPSAKPSASGTTEARPELTADARQGYIDLKEQIKEITLQNEALKRRVAEDYEKCGQKHE